MFIFSPYLLELVSLSGANELYSHIPFIPAVSVYLAYSNRKRIFTQTQFSPYAGSFVLLCAAAIFIAGQRMDGLSETGYLALMILSWIISLAACFTAVYGKGAARRALFPIAFLLFSVPAPEAAIDAVTHFLQSGSTEVASMLFDLSGAPVHREGYFFHLPGLTVEVAKQCSGIRSSLALLISGVLAGHLFLKTWAGKAALLSAIIPIAIVKNGLRITALTLSGYYIDERMLYGSLHTRGGMVFFAIAVLIAGCAIWLLRGIERKALKKNAAGA